MVLMWAAITPFRNWLTLSDYVEGTMAQYMLFTSLAMPAAMVHRALHAYASSLNRPRLIMLVSFRGVCIERAAELYFRLRQIRYAHFGRCGLRTGDDGGVLVQRAGIVDLYR